MSKDMRFENVRFFIHDWIAPTKRHSAKLKAKLGDVALIEITVMPMQSRSEVIKTINKLAKKLGIKERYKGERHEK